MRSQFVGCSQFIVNLPATMLLVAKQSVFSIECLLWWKVITHDACFWWKLVFFHYPRVLVFGGNLCLFWWKVITHDAGSDSYQANSLILFEQEPCKHSLAIFFLHLHQQLELLL